MTAFILLVVLGCPALAVAAWLWHRAGRRWSMISTRERQHRSRASFLFSERGRRRRSARRPSARNVSPS